METGGYGAPIERGTVVRLEGSRPVIESIDRPELITLPLALMAGTSVNVGDIVYFCAFEDGMGLVLANATNGGEG